MAYSLWRNGEHLGDVVFPLPTAGRHGGIAGVFASRLAVARADDTTGGAAVSPTANSMTYNITDDDLSPAISVLHGTVNQPAIGATGIVTITVTLSAPSNRDVAMSFAAEAFTGKLPPGLPLRGTLGSATGGTSCAGSADFVQTSHRVTLSPVTTSKTFQVTLCDDGLRSPPNPRRAPSSSRSGDSRRPTPPSRNPLGSLPSRRGSFTGSRSRGNTLGCATCRTTMCLVRLLRQAEPGRRGAGVTCARN